MRRYGSVIGLSAEGKARYLELHRAGWPGVLDGLRRAGIRNYTIFLKEPENLLFGYFEYVGADFAADQARLAEDPLTQEWQKLVGPLQRPLETRAPGEWWADMREIFHMA